MSRFILIELIFTLMVVARRTGAIFLHFALACKTPNNNAFSAGYDWYEATVKERRSAPEAFRPSHNKDID